MNRPNIVIINPDQMRADALHHLGNEAASTPYMDALAAEGVSYSHAFCQNPVCVPSRCSFTTGYYPHVHGHRTMQHLLRRGESNLFQELKAAGYYVWSNARGDLIAGQDRQWLKENFDVLYSEAGTEHGKDEGRGEKGSDTYFSFYRGVVENNSGTMLMDTDAVWTKGAVEHIHNRPKDQPMLLFLGLQAPHPPYRVEQMYIDRIDSSKLPKRIPSLPSDKPAMEVGLHQRFGMQNWSEERYDRLRTVYLGMCARVDDLVGQVVQALKEEGIYEDTAIFILSDHGDYTGDYALVEKAQNAFPDCLTNVPLIIKPPRGEAVDPGVNHNLVELVDFYATAIDYAGVIPNRTHFGQSLRESIGSKSVKTRKYVFCEGGRNHGETQCMEKTGFSGSAGMDEYEPRLSLQAMEGPEHTKATMIRSADYKYVKRLYERDELYDLQNDPWELHNVIDDPAYSDVRIELKEAMLEWYQRTCDAVPMDYDSRFDDAYFINLMGVRGAPIAWLKEEVLVKGRPLSEVLAAMRARNGK